MAVFNSILFATIINTAALFIGDVGQMLKNSSKGAVHISAVNLNSRRVASVKVSKKANRNTATLPGISV